MLFNSGSHVAIASVCMPQQEVWSSRYLRNDRLPNEYSKHVVQRGGYSFWQNADISLLSEYNWKLWKLEYPLSHRSLSKNLTKTWYQLMPCLYILDAENEELIVCISVARPLDRIVTHFSIHQKKFLRGHVRTHDIVSLFLRIMESRKFIKIVNLALNASKTLPVERQLEARRRDMLYIEWQMDSRRV